MEKGLSLVFNIPIIYHRPKKIRKNELTIPEKNTEMTNRQTDDGDFIGPSVRWESKNVFLS